MLIFELIAVRRVNRAVVSQVSIMLADMKFWSRGNRVNGERTGNSPPIIYVFIKVGRSLNPDTRTTPANVEDGMEDA